MNSAIWAQLVANEIGLHFGPCGTHKGADQPLWGAEFSQLIKGGHLAHDSPFLTHSKIF